MEEKKTFSFSYSYREILKSAWKITWKNKVLWWFGLAAAITGFNWFAPDKNKAKTAAADFFSPEFLFSEKFWPLVIILAVALFLIGLWGRGALIKSIGRILKKEPLDFQEGARDGRKYFKKIFLIGLLTGLFSFLGLAIVSLPVIVLFLNRAYAAGIVLGFLAVLIAVPMLFVLAFVRKYGEFYGVLGDISVWPALENGYRIFRKNLSSTLKMLLIFFLVGIIPCLIIAGMQPTFSGGAGIFFLLIVIGLKSLFEVFSQSVWILFWNEIAKQKQEGELVVQPETGEIKKRSDVASAPVGFTEEK